MSLCQGCGGVVGRDCFNPEECLWISRDMEMRSFHDAAERDHLAVEERRYWAAQEAAYYGEMQATEWVAEDLGPAAFVGSAS